MTISLRKSQSWVEFAYTPVSDTISGKFFSVTKGENDIATFSFDASSNLRERSDSNNKADFRDFESHRKDDLLAVIIDEEKVSKTLLRWLKRWGISENAPAKLEIQGSAPHTLELPHGFEIGEYGELLLRIQEG